jgi:hypothetical protein
LEEGVGERIACGDLLFDLGSEVVVGILGLPEAVLQGEIVDEGAVGAERLLVGALEWIFGDERPVVSAGAAAQQILKGGASVAFGGVA